MLMNSASIEYALYITKTADLKHYNSNFSRLYFGNEFCQRLIPSVDDIRYVIDFVKKNTIDFTFITPFVTNDGLWILKNLFSEIESELPGSEVVFSDWGILQILNKEYQGLKPLMGRLINKMKRGPRILNFWNKLPRATSEYYRTCSITTPHYIKFLIENRVGRVEIDNLLQGVDIKSIGAKLSASLYVPYAYITVTRLCLSASCEDPSNEDLVGIFECKKECQKYTFNMESPAMPTPLIRKGNTIFYKNDSIPEDMEDQKINRIVVQPEIPI